MMKHRTCLNLIFISCLLLMFSGMSTFGVGVGIVDAKVPEESISILLETSAPVNMAQQESQWPAMIPSGENSISREERIPAEDFPSDSDPESTDTTLLTTTTGDNTIDEAINDILAEGKGVFLFLYIEGSDYCEKLKPMLEDMAQKSSATVRLLQIDSKDNSQVLEQLGSSGCPDLYLIFARIDDGYLYVRMSLPAYEDLIISGSEMVESSKADTTVGCSDCGATQDLNGESILQETIDEILAEDLPVFLFFYADWCGFCQKQKPVIEALESYYRDEIRFLWVNEKDYRADLGVFSVTGFPAMFLITGKEDNDYIYKKFAGYIEEEKLRATLDYLMGKTELISTNTIGSGPYANTSQKTDASDISSDELPAIYGTVYNFVDGSGIEGVTVMLISEDSSANMTVTDAEGEYSFTNVIPGDYSLQETNLPGYSSITDDEVDITVIEDELYNVDFADIPIADLPAIGGRVYNISDGSGMEGVTLNLTTNCLPNTDCIPSRTTLTGADGKYIFTGLDQLGVYTVTEIQPSGYSSVSEDQVSKTITEIRYYQVDFEDEEFDCNNEWIIDACVGLCSAVEGTCSWACGAAEDVCKFGCQVAEGACSWVCGAAQDVCKIGCHAGCYIAYGLCDYWGLCDGKLDRCKNSCNNACDWSCSDCIWDCENACDINCDACILDCEQNCQFSCQGAGEYCNPIDPGFGTSCANDLNCIPTFGIVTDNAFTCFPEITDEPYSPGQCRSLWVKEIAESAMEINQAWSFGAGWSLAGFSTTGEAQAYTTEIGNVYGPAGEYGCYVTTCEGFTTDIEAGIFYCSGLYDYENFPGVSSVIVEEVSTDLGVYFSTAQIISGEELIGTSSCLGLEASLSPGAVSYYECNTYFILVGKYSGGELLVLDSPANIAPLVNAGPDTTANEGEILTISGSFSDSDSVFWTGTANFGDDSGEQPLVITGNTFIASHIYKDNSVYSVEVHITDEMGNTGTDIIQVTVNNVAPTLEELAAVSPIDETDTTQLWGEFSDPGLIDVHTVTIDWGDDTSDTFDIEKVEERSFFTEHQYLDDEPSGTTSDDYSITVTIDDNEGGMATGNIAVTVDNVDPIITVNGDTIDENGTATVSGTITDPGNLDTFTVVIDWGEGTPETFSYPAGSTSYSETHQYLDDNPSGTPSDSYQISVTVTDDDTGSDTETNTVVVNNVNPVVTGITMSQPNYQFILPVVHELDFEGTFTDVGTQDIHTAEWDWGVGSTIAGVVSESGGSGKVTGSHTYAEPGDYILTLTVTDDDTGVHSNTMTVPVVDVAEALEITNTYIQGLGNNVFKGKADNRKNALGNMFGALNSMLVNEAYNGMIQFMRNNLRDKFDGQVDGKPNNDWITDQKAQEELCQKIDDINAYLEYLLSLK